MLCEGLSGQSLEELQSGKQIESKPCAGFSDLRIRTKDKRLIRFDPNSVQSSYLAEILPNWRSGEITLRGLRDIVLKARQEGISTLFLGLFFLDTVNVPRTHTVIVAHDRDSTDKLWKVIQRFYANLSESIKPSAKYASKRELYWPEIDSSIYVGTAGDKSFGRGDAVNNVLASEVAFWPDAETLLTGLSQAVPRDGNIVLESTANGLGNHYHTVWTDAVNGQSAYTPRFYAWFDLPEYRAPVPKGFERTAKEQALAEAHALDDAQLAWYREKSLELKSALPQEYPSTPIEAFLATGNAYFDRQKLNALLQSLAAKAPLEVRPPEGLLTRLEKGELKIYKAPERGRSYVIAADTAEGLTESGDTDFDSADVLDQETWEQVAHLHGKWDTQHYGLLLAELGLWYESALLAVERNNHGHAVLNALIHTAGYPNLYEHEEYDQGASTSSKRPGWPTTPKTKYVALDGLASSLANGDLVLNCAETVAELITFVKLPGGRAGGEKGCHDDRVTSLAIADAVNKACRPQPFGAW